jgi:hypothetical protein
VAQAIPTLWLTSNNWSIQKIEEFLSECEVALALAPERFGQGRLCQRRLALISDDTNRYTDDTHAKDTTCNTKDKWHGSNARHEMVRHVDAHSS